MNTDKLKNHDFLKADEYGQITLYDGTLLVRIYPAGDCDTIDAANPDMENLRHALYAARECGEVPPDVSIFILPDHKTSLDIDTGKSFTLPVVVADGAGHLKIGTYTLEYKGAPVALDDDGQCDTTALGFALRTAQLEGFIPEDLDYVLNDGGGLEKIIKTNHY
jgi:hypothetical protein